VFRQGLETVQGVLTETASKHRKGNGEANGDAFTGETFPDFEISENMVRWSEGLAREAIVRVVGVLQHPPEDEGQFEVKSASVREKEIKIGMVSPLTASHQLVWFSRRHCCLDRSML
jgi:aspartyl/asparaginyl-tRNA synthetase